MTPVPSSPDPWLVRDIVREAVERQFAPSLSRDDLEEIVRFVLEEAENRG